MEKYDIDWDWLDKELRNTELVKDEVNVLCLGGDVFCLGFLKPGIGSKEVHIPGNVLRTKDCNELFRLIDAQPWTFPNVIEHGHIDGWTVSSMKPERKVK